MLVLELDAVDVEEIAMALADQDASDHCWLIDADTGALSFWTADTGIDGSNPVELDELDLLAIEPLPSQVWYADMVDFALGLSDLAVARRLESTLRGGRGAFRRFRDEVFRDDSELGALWRAFNDARARRRAAQWLLEHELVDEQAVRAFVLAHPDPELP